MNSPLTLLRKKASAPLLGLVSPSDESAPAGLTSDSKRAASVGLWALGLGFGGFLLWAAWAPLDEGVPAVASVAIDTKRKPVQHTIGGLVKEVLVKEAQKVQVGQILLRMDDAVISSQFEAVRQRYLALRAIQGRLEAELVERSSINFHPDLVKESKDLLIKAQMQTQQQLFESRRAGIGADLQAIDESIRGQEALIRSMEGVLANRRNQLSILTEELSNTRSLIKEGYAPRNRGLELERMLADVNASIADISGNTSRAGFGILELRQRAIARRNEYRKEVENQLSEITQAVQSEQVKFRAVTEELARVEVKAPVAGQVLGLAVQSSGSVIQAGQKLMDVVPENEALLVEAKVAPHLIDKVRVGLPVDIRFSGFAHSPQLVVQGSVESISTDLLTEQQTGATYYLARVGVTKEGLTTLGSRQMQPGMPAEVVFKTGERSLLTYLTSPLTKRIAASMKEE